MMQHYFSNQSVAVGILGLMMMILTSQPGEACTGNTCCEERKHCGAVVKCINPYSCLGEADARSHGLGHWVPGIESVDSISIVDYNPENGEPLFEFEFYEDFNAAQSAADIAKSRDIQSTDGEWHGFISHLKTDIESGIVSHFILDLTLEPGVNPKEFVESVREFGRFVTSGSTRRGSSAPIGASADRGTC